MLGQLINRPAESLRRKLGSGFGWLAFAQVARRIAGLAVTAVLARILSPQDFGLVALASLATQLLGIVTEMGLTSALIQRREADESDLSTGFWLALASSCLFAVAGLALSSEIGVLFHEPRIVPLFRVMLLSLPISALGQLPDVVLQRKLEFRTIAHIDWISGIGSGIMGIAAAFAGYGLWSLVIQFISAAVLTTVLREAFVRWRPRLVFRRATARRIVSYGSSLVAVGLVNYATVNIDNALIGARIGAAALGFYMLAYNLVLLPANNVGALVSRVMFPALASIQDDRPRFVNAYASMLRMVAVVTFPLVVGLGTTAPFAVRVFYGPNWGPTIILLEILTTIGVLQAINVSGVAYSAIGKPQLLLVWAMISLVAMTVAFAVGAQWGVTGVAWSYLVVSPVVCIPPHLIVNHLIGLPQRNFVRIIAAPLSASLVMGATVYMLRSSAFIGSLPLIAALAALAATGFVVYVITLFALAFASGSRAAPVKWIVEGVAAPRPAEA